jgi:hypothetical protein
MHSRDAEIKFICRVLSLKGREPISEAKRCAPSATRMNADYESFFCGRESGALSRLKLVYKGGKMQNKQSSRQSFIVFNN